MIHFLVANNISSIKALWFVSICVTLRDILLQAVLQSNANSNAVDVYGIYLLPHLEQWMCIICGLIIAYLFIVPSICEVLRILWQLDSMCMWMYDKSKALISVTYDTLKVKNDKEIQALSMLKGESEKSFLGQRITIWEFCSWSKTVSGVALASIEIHSKFMV